MPASAPAPTPASVDRRRPRGKFAALGVVAVVTTAVLSAGISGAATNPGLGTAGSFGVLGTSTVTNTGEGTSIWGHLGVESTAPDALTGFESAVVLGTTYDPGHPDVLQAQKDADAAYLGLDAQDCPLGNNLTGKDLGGLTLTPGVYCFDSSAHLTNALILDALGDPAAVFIFRTESTLTTEPGSSVVFVDSFKSCNVFWQIGSSATLDTSTAFVGTLIAHTSITAKTSATVEGRLIARGGAVTLDTNVITEPVCAAAIEPIVLQPVDTTPVDTTPVDTTPVDDTPVDEEVDDTPVDDTPVDDTPVDEEVDETPVADSPTDTTTPLDDAGGAALVAGPAVPATTGGPAVPELATGGPLVPALTGGPAVPESPRPPLPNTGSNLTLVPFGLLAILVGAVLVRMNDPKRMVAARSSSSGPVAR